MNALLVEFFIDLFYMLADVLYAAGRFSEACGDELNPDLPAATADDDV